MKKFLMLSGFLCMAMIGLAAPVAAPANFAGTWVLDKSKSELPQQMANLESLKWTITQDDKELMLKPEVSLSGGGGGRGAGMMNQPSTFKLDGTETKGDVNLGQMTGKATRKVKWMNDGKILELNTVIDLDFNGQAVQITTIDHWELADDGKTLRVHRMSETPRGSSESKMTFTKQ